MLRVLFERYLRLGQMYIVSKGPGVSMSEVVGLHSNSYKPITNGFAPGFVNYKKDANDSQPQVIQFTSYLPMVWWFSPGTPASSTIKPGLHDIAEILLKVALSTINKSNNTLHQSILFMVQYLTFIC